MQLVRDALATVRLGAPQVHRNLAMFPLVSQRDAPAGYVLLDEALERQLARVTEVSANGGVPELAFENGSAGRILLVDGEELVGAGESRMVDVTVLVGPGKSLVLPVSHGKRGGEIPAALAAYAATLRAEPRQRGAVLAIDGTPVGLELFDSAAAFAKGFGKLVRGYARDALATANGKTLCPPEDEVRRFIDRLLSCDAEELPALGEGSDIRLTGEAIAGGALAAEGRLVHLASHAVH
jgi:hypothetical protein